MPVAVVTGSNRGIGEEIARRLSRDGFDVVTNGRSKGRGLHYVRADVESPAGAKKVVGYALQKFKRLDALINNVGDFWFTPVSEMKLAEWDKLFDSNLRSAWLCTREALPAMRRRKSGVIINLGGPVSQTVRGNPRGVAYAMAKTALTVFTKSLAQAEAVNGIRVNQVNPGFIKTYAYSKKDVADMAPAVPMKRLGEPSDIASAVSYLCSDAARYVTGAVIDVCGGLWV